MGQSETVREKSLQTPISGLWIIVLLIGAFFRLSALATASLSPSELNEGLAALTALVDWDLPVSASSGLLLGVNRLLFWMVGAGDGAARALPALVGSLLPLVMLFFTRYLGRRGALVAAVLLAVSPSAVFYSRTVSGLIPGVAALLFLVGALLKYRDTEDSRWLLAAGLAIGIGFASGASFISLTITFALASFLVRSAGMDSLWQPLNDWRPWLAALGAALLISTSFFLFPSGLGALGGGLEAWVTGFELSFDHLLWPVSLLLVYEPLLLIFGLLGAGWAILRGSPFSKLLALWCLSGLILGLFRPQQADAVFLMLGPLGLRAANFLDQTLGEYFEKQAGIPALLAGAAVVGIMGTHVFVSLGQYAYFGSLGSADTNTSLLLIGIATIVIVGVLALLWTYNQELAVNSLFLALGVVLAVFGVGKAWELGHTHRSDPRELWVKDATAPGVELLLDMLKTTSQRTSRSSYTLPLTVQVDDLALRWYLRDFDNVNWVDSLQPSIISEAVITPIEAEYPLLGDSYLGMDVALRWAEAPEPEIGIVGSELRWWLQRQAPSPRPTQQVVLWLRQDVALLGTP